MSLLRFPFFICICVFNTVCMSFFSAGLQRFDTKLPSPSGFVHQYIAEHRFGADDTLNSLRGVPTLVSLCRYSGFAFLFHAPHSVFTVSAPAFSHGSNILGVKLSVFWVKFAVNQRIALTMLRGTVPHTLKAVGFTVEDVMAWPPALRRLPPRPSLGSSPAPGLTGNKMGPT